jgi:hypothetical protein
MKSTLNQPPPVDDLDQQYQQLRQLVTETCSHARGSLERQRGLNQIIWKIQQSGKLWRGNSSPSDGYEDALQQSWLYFCRNLCEATTGNAYDSERANVITWLNAYLKCRLQDARQEQAEQKYRAVDRQVSDGEELLDPVDNLPAQPDPPPILQEIREWVAKEGSQLRRIHVRDRPDINCQVLILRRLPPESTWEELSREFGVAIATLSNFYQRECFPKLRNFGKTQGYF